MTAHRPQDLQRSKRFGLGHAKFGAFLALLVVTSGVSGCAGQSPSSNKSAPADVTIGVDAEFGVETFALTSPTITASSPVNLDQFNLTLNGDSASVDFVYTVASYTGNEVHCYRDGVLFGTFTVSAPPSSSTVTFTGLAKGAHSLACVLLDATGQDIVDPTGAAQAVRQVRIIAPCTKDADCNDGNSCSGEYCQVNVCKVQVIPNCCTSPFDCAAGSNCLNPNTANSQCSACVTDNDCGDGDDCTTDKCDLSGSKGICTHNKTDANCCTKLTDACSDGKPCTNDLCVLPSGGGLGTCSHTQPPGACCADSECASDDFCKVGGCVAFTCRYAVNGAKQDCCSPTTNSNCDDKNSCTADTCSVMTSGGWTQCSHTKSDPTCCDPKIDMCDDGQPCTLDQCLNGQCVHTKNTQCCQNDSMCDDSNLCTTDTCDVKNELCLHAQVAGCCNINTECNDNSYCTNDYCDVPINTCKHMPLYQGCCDVDTDCNDGKVCTTDVCVNHQCLGLFINGCCDSFIAGTTCNDKLFCTIDSCDLTTNTCVHLPGPVTDCCDTPLTCDDGDCATLDTCNTSNQCSHKADPYACKADADCDDGKPCTADHCNVGANGCGGCSYTMVTNCCADDIGCVAMDKQNNAYLAVCHNAVCNPTTHFCDITDKAQCCLSDADAVTKCDDGNPCTVEYCQNAECRHSTPPVGCCANDAACNDNVACSIDKCNIVAGAPVGTCQYTLTGPNCSVCTPTNPTTFADNNVCTADTCVAGIPTHTPITGCCLDKTDCDDGLPCTADTCFNNVCLHSDTLAGTPVCCNPLTETTECASFNSDCTVGKCLTQTDGTLACQATKKAACTVNLSYCQDFSQSSDLSTLGWDPANVSGTAATNWGTSTTGNLGPDRFAQFNWTPTKVGYDTCLQSPVFLGAGTTNITIQYDREFIPNIGETSIRILGSLDGTYANWANATVIDTFTTTNGVGPETVDLTLPTGPTGLVGSNGLRLAFCVSGASTANLSSYAIDNVCVVRGTAPVITACPTNQVVPTGTSIVLPVKVKDADAGDIITATLSGGPAFVQMSTMAYHFFDQSWNGSLTISPTGVGDVGEYALTLKVSDGYLYHTCNFSVTVTYQGGALVWRPTGAAGLDVPQVMSDSVKSALTAQGQIAQVIRDLTLYPSLNKFSSVFVLLGNYPDNHVLLESETASLKLYLAQGGKVYMEGGDTFMYDAKTTLHPFFKAKGVLDSAPNGVTGPLAGYAAFADNTQNPPKHYAWNFNQDPTYDNMNDQIAADTSVQRTREILRNNGVEKFAVMVGHDDLTSKYRTIASSVPFAGVTAGTDAPSQMMKSILAFFTNGFGTCVKNLDCDDGDGCTSDVCASGECTNVNTCLCGGDTAISCGDQPLQHIVTNSGASTNAVTSYTCDPLNTYLGHEVALTYKGTQSKPVTVTISNLSDPTARLFVIKATSKGCDPAGCIGFGDTGNSVTFAAGKDQLYYFVVDVPAETGSSQFDIAISCGIGENCTNLADDNNNNLIDCADPASCCGDAACAKEICDGIDNNCNGQIDEGCDKDGDGFCDATYVVVGHPTVCFAGVGDCNDLDSTVNPGMPEICGNGKDDNCINGQDEENASGCVHYYRDGDADGFGLGTSLSASKCLCAASGQYKATVSGDCNDATVDVNPGVQETCATPYDDNCDGNDNDQGALLCKNFYTDIDADGYGTSPFICQCHSAGLLTATKPGDCLDTDANVNPGSPEKCNNIDDNCNQLIDEGCDDDGDKYCDITMFYDTSASPILVCPAGPGDTNDNDPTINPAGSEVCDNQDNNSNGQTDEGCDKDGDGYCDANIYTSGKPLACPQGGGDCDDNPDSHLCVTGTQSESCVGASINPGVHEDCNTSYDDNCNGSNNDQNADHCQPFFKDTDLDKWGNTLSWCLCYGKNQYTAINPGDCQPDNPLVNPAAVEWCDDIDNNCDGQTDEGCDVDGDGYCHVGAIFDPLHPGFPKVCLSGGGDCNDNNPNVNPGKAENCNTANIDDNCNGTANDQNALNALVFYQDLDGDSYGSLLFAKFCAPSGAYTATNSADCDDTKKAVNPAALEICDNLDNNCDGHIDEGCDKDHDGQCDANIKFVGPVTICPLGTGDCNDNDPAIYKGKSQETCDNKDDNCNGKVDDGCDKDQDGYCDASYIVSGTPCQASCTGKPEGTPCDDGNTCTLNDQCHYGECVSASPRNCDDGNACTDDACNYMGGCTHTGNTAGCNDGNLCTTNDTCLGSVCNGGSTLNPDDGNPCTQDACDPGAGITHVAVGDNYMCCSGYACSNGLKTCGGAGIGDGQPCFTDKCHAAGTCATAAPVCTAVMTETFSGITAANQGVQCQSGDTVLVNLTNPTWTGVSHAHKTASGDIAVSFYDGNSITMNTGVAANVAGETYTVNFVGGPSVWAACNQATTAAGGVVFDVVRADNSVLTTHLYQPGAWAGTQTYTAASFTYVGDGTGLVRLRMSDNLNDNAFGGSIDNLSITPSVCGGVGSSSCNAGTAISCDDGNPCTTDSCDPGSGCQHVNNTGSCDDGNACTSNDVCANGLCTAGTQKDCNDTNSCTQDSCNSATGGCVHGAVNDGQYCCSGTECACIPGSSLPAVCPKGPGDCDDKNSDRNPGVSEICNNGIDDNCNGSQNDQNAVGCTTYFYDADKDTWGLANADGICVCTSAGSYNATQTGDCNDNNAAIHPGALEICDVNNVDENCNGVANELGASGCVTRYYDGDLDGYGLSISECSCGSTAPYTALVSGDCDDTNAQMRPSTLALPWPEKCDNFDNNCNAQVDEGCNKDGDLFCDINMIVVATPAVCSLGGGDCDDTDPLTNPGGHEICDGKDNNCKSGPVNGVSGAQTAIDEGCDKDGDTYCDANMTTVGTPAVCIHGGNDCDDSNAAINPGAKELCSTATVDDNCSGGYNDVNAVGCTEYFADYDGDTYGKGSSSFQKAIINEVHYSTSGLTGSGGDWFEILVTADWTATDMAGLYFGDSQAARTSKVGAYHLNLASLGITTLKAGTIIVVGGSGAIPTEDKTYDPANNDWNLSLWAGGTDQLAIEDGPGGDIASGSDEIWIDTSASGTTSIDSWVWGSSPGVLGQAAKVALTVASPSTGTPTIVFKSDLTGLDNTSNYGAPDAVAPIIYTASPGQPNGGVNTAFVTFLRTVSLKGSGQCTCTNVGTDPYTASKGGDCDDSNNLMNPGMPEICDSVDNNCNNVADENCDKDGDHYCDANMITVGTPTSCSKGGGDCNDGLSTTVPHPACAAGDSACWATAKLINPGGTDICGSQIDYNCDGTPGSGVGTGSTSYYYDSDGDGFGVGTALLMCGPSGKYTALVPGDCDDTNSLAHPSTLAAPWNEDCFTAFDDNCNGDLNDLNAANCTQWYLDNDLDGYGASGAASHCQCSPRDKYIAAYYPVADCNDSNAAIHPGALELCDNVDNNCAGVGGTANNVDVSQLKTNLHTHKTSNFVAQTWTATQTGNLYSVEVWVSNSTGSAYNLTLDVYLGGVPGTSTGGTMPTGGAHQGAQQSVSVPTTADGTTSTKFVISGAAIPITSGLDYTFVVHTTAASQLIWDDSLDLYPDNTTSHMHRAGFSATQTGDYVSYNSNTTDLEFVTTVQGTGPTVSVDEGCDDDGDFYCDSTMYMTPAAKCTSSALPVSGMLIGDDCNDNSSSVHPLATEICDGLDNNCDGTKDDGCDADGDGFCLGGVTPKTIATGGAGAGTVCFNQVVGSTTGNDCNDTNATIHPLVPLATFVAEWCDDVDNNCDGVIDENCNQDGDTYCDSNRITKGTGTPTKLGTPAVCKNGGGDCNDGLSTTSPYAACAVGATACWATAQSINPGVPTDACDGLDNNCIGGTDEGCLDNDKDGFCNGNQPVSTTCPNGGNDCNDNDATVHPSTLALPWPEKCSTAWDDNCNGLTNEIGATGCTAWYVDADQDGYGSSSISSVCQCVQTDCNPTNPCTGAHINYSAAVGGDCADANAAIHPNALEICDNVDNNCAGSGGGTANNPDVTQTLSTTSTHKTSNFIAQTWTATQTGNLYSVEVWVSNSTGSAYNLTLDVYLGGVPGTSTGGTMPTGGAHQGAQQSVSVPTTADGTTSTKFVISGAAIPITSGLDYTFVVHTTVASQLIWDDNLDVYPDTTTSHMHRAGFSATQTGDYVSYTSNTTDLKFATTVQVATAGVTVDEGCDVDGDFHCAAGMLMTNAAKCNLNKPFPASGATAVGDDCNDNNAAVFLGAQEICDNADNNCNGVVDEGCDVDGDLYCTDQMKMTSTALCTNSVSRLNPAPGVQVSGDDCKDISKLVNPGMLEDCTTPFDDNCNGNLNEQGNQANQTTTHCTWYYYDGDGDGWGINPSGTYAPQCWCAPSGLWNATIAGDCNDGNSAIKGGGVAEVCDGLDNNCNGVVDEGCDDDGDHYCDTTMPIATGFVTTCSLSSLGSIVTKTYNGVSLTTNFGDDCDDTTKNARPGFGTEMCDGIDNNCATGFINGVSGATTNIDEGCNKDGDGYCDNTMVYVLTSPQCASGPGDCNDTPGAGFSIHPGQYELCTTAGVDDDCNGYTDSVPVIGVQMNSTVNTGCVPRYLDLDQDGYSQANAQRCMCTSTQGIADQQAQFYTLAAATSTPQLDCDDNPVSHLCNTVAGVSIMCVGGDRYVGHVEWCDNVDNDCNTVADIADTVLVNGSYVPKCNKDGDGWCDAALTTKPNLAPGPTTLCPQGGGDCNDNNASVHFFPTTSSLCPL